jgi:hypothetical protein
MPADQQYVYSWVDGIYGTCVWMTNSACLSSWAQLRAAPRAWPPLRTIFVKANFPWHFAFNRKKTGNTIEIRLHIPDHSLITLSVSEFTPHFLHMPQDRDFPFKVRFLYFKRFRQGIPIQSGYSRNSSGFSAMYCSTYWKMKRIPYPCPLLGRIRMPLLTPGHGSPAFWTF